MPLLQNLSLCDYYKCPDRYGVFALKGSLSEKQTYFKFADETLFGRCAGIGSMRPADAPEQSSSDEAPDLLKLNFNPDEVIDNLRLERYCLSAASHPATSFLGRSYYFVRPLLPVKLRRHLQKIRLNQWDQLKFPQWPVDKTVDNIMVDLLALSGRAQRVDRVPFIWFWPEGADSAAVLTHDVETRLGRDLCGTVMDIDDSFGIKAAFEIVPEKRYEVTPAFVDSIWSRGFEIAVHDLNHDGHLYADRQTFMERAARINTYRRQFRADGFRAAILYRNQAWYDALDFSYDTSVPNVAHLDPQRGGCCTVMPYFVGKLVELPVTLTQDYSLFHILNDYSIDLWQRQIELIMASHGLVNVIIHPDYSTTRRERHVFTQLLSYLAKLRTERNIWTALPKEVALWWRQRSAMRIVEDEAGIRIEGEGKERARLAYAYEKAGGLAFDFAPQTKAEPRCGDSEHAKQSLVN
jgi:hypothetical protein